MSHLMKTLLAEKESHVKAARELAAKADAEGRDFTQAERTSVLKHMEDARKAHASILELRGDAALIADMNSLGSVRGGKNDNYRASGLATAGRLDPAAIGAAFETAAIKSQSGRKALMEAGSVGVGIPTLSDEITRDAERPRRVLDLIQVAPTTDDRFRYFRQTVRTNNAAATAVGALKPTSVMTFEDVDDRTRTFAHVSEPIPRQHLDDSTMLRAFVDAELRYGVIEAIEDAVVSGDGLGENPEGILTVAGTQTQGWDSNLLVTTRKAKQKLEGIDLVPSAWLLNSADWMEMELLRDDSGGAGTGSFLLESGPIDAANQRLWGTPVVVTNAVPAGVGVLADFGDLVLVMREDIRVDVSENVADDFNKNLVRVRAEARAGIAYLRPISTVEVDLTAL